MASPVRPLLYGPTGMPLRGSSHEAASLTDRDLARWIVSNSSADLDLLGELDTIRARHRDLARNDGILSGAIQTMVDNVVGAKGVTPNLTPDHKALGKDEAWAEEYSAVLEADWREWSESVFVDVSERLNFAGLTELVFRSSLNDGEFLALPLWRPKRPGCGFSLALRAMDVDRLSTPDSRIDDRYLRSGVEIDDDDRAVAYHIRKTHPADYAIMAGDLGKWERIPAKTPWGRLRVIHRFVVERPGQHRGKPMATAIMPQFRMLKRLQKAELQAAVLEAMISLFIETPMTQDDLENFFGAFDTAEEYQSLMQNRAVAPLEGGAIYPMHPGQKVYSHTPARPGNTFAPYMEWAYRHVAAGLNMPYELLLKDFTKSNYSSARSALLEAWRFFMSRRQWLVNNWCQPVLELFLEERISRGSAPGIDLNDYLTKRRACCKAMWTGAGKGWVDPVKEAQGAQIRMEAGLSTLQRECAEQGMDWQEVIEQRKKEKAALAEAGLATSPVGLDVVPRSDMEDVDKTKGSED